MANKRILQLPTAINILSSDYLALDNPLGTSKISIAQFLQNFNASPQGFVYGMGISPTVNSITVATGNCRDSGDNTNILNITSFLKNMIYGMGWTAGAGGNGLPSGIVDYYDELTAMTANTAPAGQVAFASSKWDASTNYDAFKAFNNSSAGATNNWIAQTTITGQGVGRNNPSTRPIKGFVITSPSDTAYPTVLEVYKTNEVVNGGIDPNILTNHAWELIGTFQTNFTGYNQTSTINFPTIQTAGNFYFRVIGRQGSRDGIAEIALLRENTPVNRPLEVFIMKNSIGTTDFGFDNDMNATNLIAQSGFQFWRRIGSVLLDATGNIITFRMRRRGASAQYMFNNRVLLSSNGSNNPTSPLNVFCNSSSDLVQIFLEAGGGANNGGGGSVFFETDKGFYIQGNYADASWTDIMFFLEPNSTLNAGRFNISYNSAGGRTTNVYQYGYEELI